MSTDLTQLLENFNNDSIKFTSSCDYNKVLVTYTRMVAQKVFNSSSVTGNINQFCLNLGISLNIHGPGRANDKTFAYGGKTFNLADLLAKIGFSKRSYTTNDLKGLIQEVTLAKVARAYTYLTYLWLSSDKADATTPFLCLIYPLLPKRYGFLNACHLPPSILGDNTNALIAAAEAFDAKIKGDRWADYVRKHVFDGPYIEIVALSTAGMDEKAKAVDRPEFTSSDTLDTVKTTAYKGPSASVSAEIKLVTSTDKVSSLWTAQELAKITPFISNSTKGILDKTFADVKIKTTTDAQNFKKMVESQASAKDEASKVEPTPPKAKSKKTAKIT